MDARIGQLMREGKIVHYAFVNGYMEPAFEGTQEEVEIALGLRAKPAEVEPIAPVAAPVSKTPGTRALRTYEVTVTPSATVHVGLWKSLPYTVDITARTRDEAIKEARREWTDVVAIGISATFRARLKAE